MKKLLAYLTAISLILIFSGCSQKSVKVKTIEPAKLDKTIKNIYVKNIKDDNINLKEYLKNEIVNSTFNDKNLFKLQKNLQNSDSIVEAKILNSTVYSNFYYDESNTKKCLAYEVNNSKRVCIEYGYSKIPCHRKNFEVKANISVINSKDETVLFSKIYKKNLVKDRCYRYGNYFTEIFYDFVQKKRDIKENNNKLAQDIAKIFIKDISIHYSYYHIDLIDEINSMEVEKTKIDSFKKSIELIENKEYSKAQAILLQLNKKFDGKNWETLFTLGIIEEIYNRFSSAKSFYTKAIQLTNDRNSLKIISNAINRVGIEYKKSLKAKEQLKNH